MADETENEFMKRGYLLPNGCKDLINVLNTNAQSAPLRLNARSPAPVPPITGEILVPPKMTVGDLAQALGRKPFQIIADLMGFGVFANVKDELEFDLISKVARVYGFTAKKA